MKPFIKNYRILFYGYDEIVPCFVPATSEEDARRWVDSEEDIIECKEYKLSIDTEYLWDVLIGRKKGDFSELTADFIVRILERFYKNF